MSKRLPILIFLILLTACDSGTDTPPASSKQTAEMTPTPAAPPAEAPSASQAVEPTAEPQPAMTPATEPAVEPEPVTQPAATVVTQAPVTDPAARHQEELLKLANKSGCLACHKIEKKLVGPAWQDVAARYRGNATAQGVLVEKVKKGGKGNWTEITGGTPMPPYSPRVSDDNIKRLVSFILTLE